MAFVTEEQFITCIIYGEDDGESKHMQAHFNLVAAELKRLVPDIKQIHDEKI
jgi:hypothetical protein